VTVCRVPPAVDPLVLPPLPVVCPVLPVVAEPLPELLLSAETGAFTAPGRFTEISDPPAVVPPVAGWCWWLSRCPSRC